MKKQIVELVRRAHTQLPGEVVRALKAAYKREDSEIARLQLRNILENIKLAKKLNAPLCQDTGLPIFYVYLAKDADRKAIEKAIINGVKEATQKVPLRQNVVDPLTRKNSGNNAGEGIPLINWKFSNSSATEVLYFPKGAGSENCSAAKMLEPSEGLRGVKEFVLETVKSAGGKPCPPTIAGVGIGGSLDLAAKLAKEALLRPINSYSKKKDIAKLEKELLEEINKLGIGPMGLGGRTTSLKVNVECAACHTASLPVAVNIECWAHRYARAIVHGS
ncbi:MAG: fumarate hydratase [Candidatus Hydrothermarchaeota archaeon]|nr:fumarate hydratase [Candidatus Hydrothermarchaeota archaeon]